MKRFFVYLALILLVLWAVKSNHPRSQWSPPRPPARWHGPRMPETRPSAELAEAQRQSRQALAEAGRAIEEARREVRQAYEQANGEIRQAWHEVKQEVRQAYHQALKEGVQPPVPAPPPPVLEREPAEGIPVDIVPGTRVTEAEAKPPVPPVAPRVPMPVVKVSAPLATANTTQMTSIEGQISATKERAEADARAALQSKIADWLEPEVPRTWSIPTPLLQSLIAETRFRPEEKPYGTLYWAELKVNLSPDRRYALVQAYTQEVVRHRLMSLGGALTFVLIGLAAITGYIRADEATKGYYTNRLRMLAAAGVGAAGVIVYRMVA